MADNQTTVHVWSRSSTLDLRRADRQVYQNSEEFRSESHTSQHQETQTAYGKMESIVTRSFVQPWHDQTVDSRSFDLKP
jgi:hypothetical protein